jgi:hypothetical protein
MKIRPAILVLLDCTDRFIWGYVGLGLGRACAEDYGQWRRHSPHDFKQPSRCYYQVQKVTTYEFRESPIAQRQYQNS